MDRTQAVEVFTPTGQFTGFIVGGPNGNNPTLVDVRIIRNEIKHPEPAGQNGTDTLTGVPAFRPMISPSMRENAKMVDERGVWVEGRSFTEFPPVPAPAQPSGE